MPPERGRCERVGRGGGGMRGVGASGTAGVARSDAERVRECGGTGVWSQNESGRCFLRAGRPRPRCKNRDGTSGRTCRPTHEDDKALSWSGVCVQSSRLRARNSDLRTTSDDHPSNPPRKPVAELHHFESGPGMPDFFSCPARAGPAANTQGPGLTSRGLPLHPASTDVSRRSTKGCCAARGCARMGSSPRLCNMK